MYINLSTVNTKIIYHFINSITSRSGHYVEYLAIVSTAGAGAGAGAGPDDSLRRRRRHTLHY